MKKWLKYTLGILLTLIVLGTVGLAGYRIGRMQSVSLVRKEIKANAPATQNLPNDNQTSQGDDANRPPMMQNGPGHNRFGNNHGFNERHRGGFSIFGSIFGLIQLAVLVILVWAGYQIIQNSGWRLVRVESTAPVVEVKEEKESE